MRHLAVLVVAGAVAGGGCGGGGEDKADYIRRADAICLDATNKLRALERPGTLAQFQSFATRAIPIMEDGLRRVRALDPPEEIASEADAVFDNVEKGIALIDRVAAAARRGDPVALQSLAADAGTLAARTGADAKAVGFKQCGRVTGL